MTRQKASVPFVKNNDDEVLWLGLVARDTGIPASRRLQIQDEVLALNFDKAVTLRLLRYDNERERDGRKFMAAIFHGSEKANELFPDDDILGADILAGDPYADKNTQVW